MADVLGPSEKQIKVKQWLWFWCAVDVEVKRFFTLNCKNSEH
jgi:hypothetical protein